MPRITDDWDPLGKNIYYRCYELYQMAWAKHVDLKKSVISGAAFGGPIAMMRDDKKLLRVQGVPPEPFIFIFSSAGRQISSIKWNSGKILTFGWSDQEDLLVVQDDGSVLVYNIFGTYLSTFSMGQEAKETKVLDAKIFNSYQGTGVVVLTTQYRVFLVNSVKDPRIRKLADIPGFDSPPSCWVIFCEDRNTSVYLSRDQSLYLLQQNVHSPKPQFPKFSTPYDEPPVIVEMAVSYDNKRIALFTSSGILWFGSSELRPYVEFNTKQTHRPLQMMWCGTGAVVCYWGSVLLIVGLNKDCLEYYYEKPIHLIQELDGIRIVSQTEHSFLQKVPAVVADIFSVGSPVPGAILFEATKEFQNKSHRADDYIRNHIKDQLGDAVEQCIEAAGHEYQPATQKLLLRAASFGKCFVPDFKPDSFVKMCQYLKVLNAIRDYTIGLPLTHKQLEYLTMPIVIDRLVLRRHYCLAVRICKYLKIPDTEGASRILAHWACYKVNQTQLDSDLVARVIAEKIGYTPGVSYSEIASKAYDCGREELAIKLVDYEMQAAKQVPLLMKLSKPEQALQKAIDGGDTDLMYFVILRAKELLPQKEFCNLIKTLPEAHTLYLKYCKQYNLDMLRNIYYIEDNFQGEADLAVSEYSKATRTDEKLKFLHSAVENYRKARNDFAVTHTQEQISLLQHQLKYEDKFQQKDQYVGLTLHDTVHRLLILQEIKPAEDLRKEFNIPQKHFSWLKLQAFAEIRRWDEVEKMSKVKKSPIGFEPFVDVCLKHNNQTEALKYLPRVQEDQKIRYYIKAGKLSEAATIAFEKKDEQGLASILSKCGSSNAPLAEQIRKMSAQLKSK